MVGSGRVLQRSREHTDECAETLVAFPEPYEIKHAGKDVQGVNALQLSAMPALLDEQMLCVVVAGARVRAGRDGETERGVS